MHDVCSFGLRHIKKSGLWLWSLGPVSLYQTGSTAGANGTTRATSSHPLPFRGDDQVLRLDERGLDHVLRLERDQHPNEVGVRTSERLRESPRVFDLFRIV